MLTRDEAIATLERDHGAVASLLSSLPEDDLVRRGTIGGGHWSAKDLAAHMGVWEKLALQALDEWRRGQVPSIGAVLATDHGTDRVNDEGVRRFLDASWDEVRTRFEDLHGRFVAAIRSIDEAEWSAPHPGDPGGPPLGDRLGSLLGSEDGPYRHASAHLPDLQAYVDTTKA